MWPFSDRKALAVKNRVLELINKTCPGLSPKECRRVHNRTQRVVVGVIIPIENRELQADQVVRAVTKDFSSGGVAMVLNQPLGPEQFIVGFRLNGSMTFFRAEKRHQEAIEGGFHQVGFQLFEVVSPKDYPGLESFSL
jgi:c-di-GMP-binding flagellar brake protein YcgR